MTVSCFPSQLHFPTVGHSFPCGLDKGTVGKEYVEITRATGGVDDGPHLVNKRGAGGRRRTLLERRVASRLTTEGPSWQLTAIASSNRVLGRQLSIDVIARTTVGLQLI